MSTVIADRLMEQLELVCDELIREVQSSANELTQAQAIGMAALRDHLLKTFDFRALAAAAPQTSTVDIAALVRAFCLEQCGASRQQPPGAAAECGGCQLRVVALGNWEAQAREVTR